MKWPEWKHKNGDKKKMMIKNTSKMHSITVY